MTKTKKEKVTKDKVAASIPIYNLKGKEVETFDLDKNIFDGNVNKGILYHAVRSHSANQRQGTASTKTTSEVSGGGKKPWAQKGTGRARHASIRSPLWRGGGKIFGPHPRNYHYSLPRKINALALVSSLNSKLKDRDLLAIESLSIDEPKTKKFKAILDALKLKGKKTLFILESLEDNVALASRNLKEVRLRNYKDFNVLDVLGSEKVVMSKGALAKLSERLKGI